MGITFSYSERLASFLCFFFGINQQDITIYHKCRCHLIFENSFFKDTNHLNVKGTVLAQHHLGGRSALWGASSPSFSCDRCWWQLSDAVTPLCSELVGALEEEQTPASASALEATGCVWHGRAEVPETPGPTRDTKKAEEKLFYKDQR